MAIYPPPNWTEPIPIFNPINWEEDETTITIEYLNAHYLKFPVAQGLETLQETIQNGNANLNGNLILQQGVIPPRQIVFSDGSIQTTASGGGGTLEGQYVVAAGLTNPQLIVAPTQGTTFDINIPLTTRITKITIVGGGGQAGTNVLDGDTMYAGGTGGGGSYGQFTLDITNYPAVSPLLQYKFTNGGAGVGLTGLLFWSPAAIAKFPELNNNGGNLTFAFGGGVGGNATIGSGGNAGVSGSAGLSVQAGLLTQGNDGSAGVKTTAGFSYSSTTLAVKGGNNAFATLTLNANGLGVGALGEGWNFAPSTTPTKTTQGLGAIYLEFFT